MEFKVMSKEAIKNVERRAWNNKAVEFVEQFAESGEAGAEVTFAPGEYKDAASCAGVIKNAIQKTRRTNLKVFTRKGKVYVVNALKCD